MGVLAKFTNDKNIILANSVFPPPYVSMEDWAKHTPLPASKERDFNQWLRSLRYSSKEGLLTYWNWLLRRYSHYHVKQ